VTAVLELEGLGRRYGELDAVSDVTLAIEAGSRHALIWPNGAGKSTLFGLISGTVRSTSGRIRFDGHDVTRRGPHRRTRLGIGRTFQHSSLFDGISARENVAVAAQRQLGHASNVALALATQPKLLLLDEPTAGMSRDEAARFLELIGSLPAELTIMIVEHDMDVVFGLATQIAVLDAGKLIANGPPEEIRNSTVVQEAYLGPGDRMEQLFTP
jgi:branched-chain amino acid transport system ATP-binding protein